MFGTYHEPRYERGQAVSFRITDDEGNGRLLTGTVMVVDAYGAGLVDGECCYDVSVEGLGWFKHLRESLLESVGDAAAGTE